MTLRTLVPWRHRKVSPDDDPFAGLHREIDEICDPFSGARGMAPGWGWRFAPSIDVTETETEVCVSADTPGMDKKEIELSLSNDRLINKGKKMGPKK